jgi:hypothetical protein
VSDVCQITQQNQSKHFKIMWFRPPALFGSCLAVSCTFGQVYTGLLKLTVGILTTCHTQYTWDRNM